MINLLPPDNKRQIQAGRSNTLLLRYNLFLLIAVGFLLVAIGVVYVYLGNTKTAAEQTIKENQARVNSYAEIEKQSNEFKANLAIAKQILSKEVVYTDVVLQIAALMPPGVILDNLKLDAKTFGTKTTLAAHSKTIADAIALKESFQKSPLFSDVNFQIISTPETGSGSYPVGISLNVTIKKEIVK
jgi:Tfp pilus assembly protein PilN